MPGELKAIRAAGSYTINQPDPLPCREYSGDEGLVVLFSVRGTEEVMFSVMKKNIIAAWGMQDYMK